MRRIRGDIGEEVPKEEGKWGRWRRPHVYPYIRHTPTRSRCTSLRTNVNIALTGVTVAPIREIDTLAAVTDMQYLAAVGRGIERNVRLSPLGSRFEFPVLALALSRKLLPLILYHKEKERWCSPAHFWRLGLSGRAATPVNYVRNAQDFGSLQVCGHQFD